MAYCNDKLTYKYDKTAENMPLERELSIEEAYRDKEAVQEKKVKLKIKIGGKNYGTCKKKQSDLDP